MKRLFPISAMILLCLLLSCQSITYGYGDGRTPEEIQLSLEILLRDSFDMAPDLVDADKEDLRPFLPPSLSGYRNTLPLYDELEDAYLSAAWNGMEDAIRHAIDLFREADTEIPYTYDYINEKTLSSILKEEAYPKVLSAVIGEIPGLLPELDDAWERLRAECTVLKKNYENLSSVTVMNPLEEPEPIPQELLASYITSEALEAVSDAEEYLRNRPLSENTERSYQIFWEEW